MAGLIRRGRMLIACASLAFTTCWVTVASAQVIPPKAHFGFEIGRDYHLANYTQTDAYFHRLTSASDRVLEIPVGKTSEERDMYLYVISSPENLAKIETYKAISQQMARAELGEEEARRLAISGKPVIWIDGGLHATETVGTHQLIETFYQLVSRDDAETLRILDEVIVLLFHCNPDGQELVSDWYMHEQDTLKRNKAIPRLYHKYVGHDNNRDFYMNNLSESTVISRLQYIEWMPQVIYNHHQPAPVGTVLAGPPYRDPFNYFLDPLLITGIEQIASAMITRLHEEGKPGYTRLSGSRYSTWWNGGLRTAPYFHNSIGILTEMLGDPTPTPVPVVPDRLVPNNATPFPLGPQSVWHFRQGIDYSVSLNYAILNYASRHGDELLLNSYRMGRNSIERGRRDSWTLKPRFVSRLKQGYQEEEATFSRGAYDSVYRAPELRDPRGYIITADQVDFPRAVAFLNALVKSGVRVHRATADFSVQGKHYPKGSYIVKTDQAFRPHVLDMFEPQDHPNDFQYPGGPPVPPYDAAGWTLVYQFGISYDRVLDALQGPFEALPYGELLSVPPGTVAATGRGGYLLNASVNNTFKAVNALLADGIDVLRVPVSTHGMPAGAFVVPPNAKKQLIRLADSLGLFPVPLDKPLRDARSVKPVRIGLFDYYGGSMPSGWVRWIFEQYGFPMWKQVYPQDIDRGKLNSEFDVLLFVGEGIPLPDGTGTGIRNPLPSAMEVPAEVRHMAGAFTAQSAKQVRLFIEAGGRVVSVGKGANLSYHLHLPIANALTDADGEPLSQEQFYAPGSIHSVFADTTDVAGWGMPAQVDVVHSNNTVFRVMDTALVKPLVWYGTDPPLRSGWVWGAPFLANGVTGFRASLGKGDLYVFSQEITFRAQPHGTFKWLFNLLYQ